MPAPAIDAQLKALADPTRRAILKRVWDRPVAAGEIARAFSISRPAVSRHLRVLRESDLVRVRAVGTTRLYMAERRAVSNLRAFFDAFWDDGLARLKAAAEQEGR